MLLRRLQVLKAMGLIAVSFVWVILGRRLRTPFRVRLLCQSAGLVAVGNLP